MVRRGIRPAGPALALAALAAALAVGVVCAQDAQPTYDSRIAFTDRAAMSASIDSIADGVVTFQSPNFVGPVKAPTDRLAALDFKSNLKSEATDYVLLSNGDRLSGKLLGLDEESLTMDIPHIGPVSIRRNVIVQMVSTQGGSALVDLDFAVQDLTGWKIVQGNWEVQDGALVNTGGGRPQTIAFPLDHTGSVTVAMDVDGKPRGVHFDLILGAEAADANPKKGLMLQFVIYSWQLQTLGDPRPTRIGNGALTQMRNEKQGDIRLAFDTETREATIWNGDSQLGKVKVPGAVDFPEKNFLVLRFNTRSRISYIRVMDGVVEPTGGNPNAGPEERDLVMLHNGDRISVDNVQVVDGEFIVQTAGLDLTFPGDKVARVLFAEKGREEPRRLKGDARILMPAGTFTMAPESLDTEFLTGSSDYLGEVRIAREAVRRMEFNIYKD